MCTFSLGCVITSMHVHAYYGQFFCPIKNMKMPLHCLTDNHISYQHITWDFRHLYVNNLFKTLPYGSVFVKKLIEWCLISLALHIALIFYDSWKWHSFSLTADRKKKERFRIAPVVLNSLTFSCTRLNKTSVSVKLSSHPLSSPDDGTCARRFAERLNVRPKAVPDAGNRVVVLVVAEACLNKACKEEGHSGSNLFFKHVTWLIK